MKNKLTTNEVSWKKLIRANRETIPLPFELQLQESDKPLLCQTLLRIVPKKRMVLAGFWDGVPVVAKIFYGADAKRHMQREANGAKVLMHANVPTPKLLYQGSLYKNRVKIILFEKIEESIGLENIWQHKAEFPQINALMHSFTIELATQHVLGILQSDLHLNNFLVTEKRIYTLDGSTITHVDNPLDKKKSIENLGLFFSQLGAGAETLKRELFQLYVNARGWLVKPADFDLLHSSTQLAMQERWRRFAKKIYRNCTSFKKITKSFKTIIYDRDYQSTELLHMLQHPESIFTVPGTVILKQGRSATVAKCQMGDRTIVVKRYNMKGIFHWLRRCLRETRASTSWRLAQCLCLLGVPTAKPIAFVENHILGLRGKSYFFMEYVAGQNSGDFFANYRKDDLQYEMVAQRILSIFTQLNELRLTHGDLKNTNIIISNDQPILIDLDGMTEHKFERYFEKSYQKELNRFMHNWQGNVGVTALFAQLLKESSEKHAE